MMDIIAIVVIIGLVAMYALPNKILRIIDGALLFMLGLIPFLYMYNVIGFDINSYALMRFIALYLVIDVGSVLFSEAITEQKVILKILSMAIGLAIVLVTSIPWMYDLGAISFTMPSYAPIVDFALYIIAGALAILGAFGSSD